MPEVYESIEETWNKCLNELEKKIPPQTFSTWFKPIVPLRFHDSKLIIQVPSRFHYEWIEEHYNDLFKNVLLIVFGFVPSINYTIGLMENSFPDVSNYQTRPTITNELALPTYTRLNARYTFDNFVEGNSNQFAKAASLAVAEAPGKTTFNPLLIYGGVGLGKTHLIQAIGNFAVENGKARRIRYISSEKFTLDFITSIQNNSTTKFSKLYRSVDLLLVDDIQFFTGKERTQEEFFHTFNALHQKGKQIVLSCDRPPSELKGLEERLISRFTSGLIVDIQAPDFETRMAILQRKAEQDNIQIDNDIIVFIATNITSNIRELEGALIKLLAHASLNGKDISLELAKQVLRDIIKKKNSPLTIEMIQRVVCDYFRIKEDLIRAKTRKKEIVLARQLSMFLSRELTNYALKTIGLHLGGRDHSTVIHACQNIEKKINNDKQFSIEIEKVKRKIELSA